MTSRSIVSAPSSYTGYPSGATAAAGGIIGDDSLLSNPLGPGPSALTNPIFPMNLDAATAIFEGRTAAAAGAHEHVTDAFAKDKLLKLQLQVDDYLAMLDATLRNLTAESSAKLARQMRDAKDEPLTFQYFRVQQRLMKLTGEHTLEKERQMLSTLAELVEP
jgi:hypothetical protein